MANSTMKRITFGKKKCISHENENEMVEEHLIYFLNEKAFVTFQDGRYRNEVREVEYNLLAKRVS